ncbi:MAG: chromate transporter [Firmicutes bacterium]|nr:chromate transporter [Bacillota bacterium]
MQPKKRKKQATATLRELFVAWFKIGLFTFGGGYAMLPLIEREVIDKKGWTDKEEILSIYALAQSVPGVIAVNTSIILGNRLAGVRGAVVAAAGVMAPSLLVIMAIASYFDYIMKSVYVLQAFSGIRAAVVGLVAAAAVRIALASLKDKPAYAIALTAFVLSAFTEIHAIVIILGGALAGFLVYYFGAKGRAED